MSNMCEMQIAALKAELAKVTKERDHALIDVREFAEMQRRAGEGLQRVARERNSVRAELAAVTKKLDEYKANADAAETVAEQRRERAKKAEQERDAALLDLSQARAEVVNHQNARIAVEFDRDQSKQLLHAAVKRAEEAEASAADRHAKLVAVADKLRAERERANVTEAQAAAMREVIGWIYGENQVFLQNVGYRDAIEKALDSDAGRALLERHAAELAKRDALHDTVYRALSDEVSAHNTTKAELASAHEELARLRTAIDCAWKACEEHKAKLGAAVAALKSYMYNPHVATTVSEGKHSPSGFCRTCADQYTAGQSALADVESSAAGEAYREQQEAIEALRRMVNHSTPLAPGFRTARMEAIGALEKLDAITKVDARRGALVPLCAGLDGDEECSLERGHAGQCKAAVTHAGKGKCQTCNGLRVIHQRPCPDCMVRRGASIEDLRHKRGYQDGLAGLSPTDATDEYTAGYMKGREELARRGGQ